MKGFLTRTPVLWGLAVLSIALTISFVLVMRRYDFQLIDEMWNPSEVLSHIQNLSDVQKKVHIWTTATLDVAYPLAYGGLFVGLVWRFLGPAGRLLALPALAVIPVDLTEGVVQVMALSGNEAVVVHKAWVTPMKLGLFVCAAVFALVAIGVGLWRKFRGPSQL